jgi:hypothetical protein
VKDKNDVSIQAGDVIRCPAGCTHTVLGIHVRDNEEEFAVVNDGCHQYLSASLGVEVIPSPITHQDAVEATVPKVVAAVRYTGPKVPVVTSASEWLRLFGYALGAPPAELMPKYGRWDRKPGHAFTLTDAQIAEWRKEERSRCSTK